MSTAPSIMVSSTFYDLRQIRNDLFRFISDELGYIPIMSELSSFPIDPDLDTIDNCRRRVENNADILVLIIGGRYGCIDHHTDKSITNLEFLAAKNKGIPIYVFIDKGILALLPVWKDNPTSDYSRVVDSPRVFEFIEQIRSHIRIWTFPFECSRDIETILRNQLSYLFLESLKLRLQLFDSPLSNIIERLRPKALRLALERPKAWEYRLFLQSFIDEVNSRADLIREYHEGLLIESAYYIDATDAPDWFNTRLHELQNLIISANLLINESVQVAFGKPGEPGDVEHIIWVSRKLGVILENIIKWANRIRCSRLESPFDKLAPETALFVDDLINQFNTFPHASLKNIEDMLLQSPSDKSLTLKLTMEFKLSNINNFNNALDSARKHFSSKSKQ